MTSTTHQSLLSKERYALIGYPVVSGLILALSFNYPQFWFLGFFALLPLFIFLFEGQHRLREVFGAGLIFGLVFLGLAYIPIWHLLPLDWLGIQNKTLAVLFVFVYWASFIFSLALLSGGLWAMVAYKLKRGTFFDAIVCALLWVFFEYIRMWWFAVLTLGNESFVAPYFSTGFVGYALASNNALLQFAGIGGVYLLSFLIIFVNGVWYWLFFQTPWNVKIKRNIFILSLCALILLASLPVAAWLDKTDYGDHNPVKVALVQTQFPARIELSRSEHTQQIAVLRDLTHRIADENEDIEIIVYPEDSRFSTSVDMNELWALFDTLFKKMKPLIIDSSRVKNVNVNKSVVSRMFFFNLQNHTVETTDKQFFVPVGEYLPYAYRFFLTGLGQQEIISKLESNRSYARGAEKSFGTRKDIVIGGLFCSEALSPSFTNQLTRDGANIVVNVSSAAWFHESKILHNQEINVAKVRAVETNRYFLRSANFSPAFALDNHGRLLGKMPWGETGVLIIQAKPIAELSVYNKIIQALGAISTGP